MLAKGTGKTDKALLNRGALSLVLSLYCNKKTVPTRRDGFCFTSSGLLIYFFSFHFLKFQRLFQNLCFQHVAGLIHYRLRKYFPLNLLLFFLPIGYQQFRSR